MLNYYGRWRYKFIRLRHFKQLNTYWGTKCKILRPLIGPWEVFLVDPQVKIFHDKSKAECEGLRSSADILRF